MSGKTYRIRYEGDEWRDGTRPSCGPPGEPRKEPWLRRRLGLPWVRLQLPRFPEVDSRGRPEWNKKGLSVAKMTLIATLAHPRAWPPDDRPLRDAVRYLFRRGPIELIEQLAPIGGDLVGVGKSVYLHVAADVPDGMLWFFANDYWMFASNNSGSVRLTIDHVDAPPAHAPLWTLQMEPRGENDPGARRALWSCRRSWCSGSSPPADESPRYDPWRAGEAACGQAAAPSYGRPPHEGPA